MSHEMEGTGFTVGSIMEGNGDMVGSHFGTTSI